MSFIALYPFKDLTEAPPALAIFPRPLAAQAGWGLCPQHFSDFSSQGPSWCLSLSFWVWVLLSHWRLKNRVHPFWVSSSSRQASALARVAQWFECWPVH